MYLREILIGLLVVVVIFLLFRSRKCPDIVWTTLINTSNIDKDGFTNLTDNLGQGVLLQYGVDKNGVKPAKMYTKIVPNTRIYLSKNKPDREHRKVIVNRITKNFWGTLFMGSELPSDDSLEATIKKNVTDANGNWSQPNFCTNYCTPNVQTTTVNMSNFYAINDAENPLTMFMYVNLPAVDEDKTLLQNKDELYLYI